MIKPEEIEANFKRLTEEVKNKKITKKQFVNQVLENVIEAKKLKELTLKQKLYIKSIETMMKNLQKML